MKFWTHEELHEIEEALLDRKEAIEHLPDKQLAKIDWAYEKWEQDLIEQCAKYGYPIDTLSRFLCRQRADVLRYVRGLGYENWAAFCEVSQWQNQKRKRVHNIKYRDIVEAALGRPLTKEEHVHHINCDHYDDAIGNLWVCKAANHKHAHASYRELQMALLAYGVVSFNRETGDYEFDIDAVDSFYDFWTERDRDD